MPKDVHHNTFTDTIPRSYLVYYFLVGVNHNMLFHFFKCFPVTFLLLFLRGREEYGRWCRWYCLTWFYEVQIVHSI